MAKPKLAVFKFASCDGCQLSLLDCEDELLALTEVIEIANFPEASRRMLPGPYDIGLVEGSVTTEHDLTRIQEIRQQCKILITIGACATAGGIQALRNFAKVEDFARAVYPHPEYLSTLDTATPIASHVAVDFELHGCPINKDQLVAVLLAFVAGRRPDIPETSVCMECKAAGHVCVMVTRGEPCLGPVTQAGCGALCPGYARACYGCYGPKERAQVAPLATWFRTRQSMSEARLQRSLRSYNAAAEPLHIIAREEAADDA
jgi:sulfhydrogenase subunit delta